VPGRRSKKNLSEDFRVMDSVCRTLLVIDNEPIRRGLEFELELVRERVESCEKEIHRHEAIDLPAFRQWVAVHCAERVAVLRSAIGEMSGLASWRFVLLSAREVEERLRKVRREFTQTIRQLELEAHAMQRDY